MKKLNLFTLAFALLFTLSISASVINPIKPSAELRADIIELLSDIDTYDYYADEYTAEVLFTVNMKKELIVLSIHSENPNAEYLLKSELNYKRVNHIPTKEGELYLLPVRLTRN